jgi:murein DD-endopeptidase MepM/ murein hydrolase activator NlpD
MTQLLTANGMFRDRDLFIHDGSKLRRLRLSAPVQAFFFMCLLTLVGWSCFSAVRMISGSSNMGLSAAAERRAQLIEKRQELLTAMLAGSELTDAQLAELENLPRGSGDVDVRLTRAEKVQVAQAAAAARALDARYEHAAAELQKMGITPARLQQGGVGGPFEAVTKGDPTFKQLFMSWKKLDTLQDGAVAVPSDKPVKTAAFTSGFGVRSDPFQARAAMHPGIDLAGAIGTPIYATADGVVLRAGWNSGGYGNLVEIDHGRGIATRYGHMSAVLVRAGEQVTRGQQIGRMGSTGRSTGSHLHYEVRIDGRPVNPVPFMKSTDYLVAMQRKASAAPMEALALGGPENKAQR